MRNSLPPRVAERLSALRERPIEPTEKGFGLLATAGQAGPAAPAYGGGAGVTAAGLAAARPALHAAGFSYPLLTLRESALANNIEAMAAYCDRAGVALAPHGKTAMSPELAARQLAHGAWGITVATIGQLRTYRAFGFPRLLLANELVDEAGIAWLAAELDADPGFEAYCYVDSQDGVAILDQVLSSSAVRPRPAAGCRSWWRSATPAGAPAAAPTTARSTWRRRWPPPARSGWRAWPGTREPRAPGARPGRSGRSPPSAVGCGAWPTPWPRPGPGGRPGAAAGSGEDLIVTAGGSAYFDVVTRELTAGGTAGLTVILRSGAYLTHDHGYYGAVSPAGRDAADAPALRPALELWAQVLSRPEPGLALLGAGRRDAGFDQGLPVPLRVVRRGAAGAASMVNGEVTELNDQHAYLRLDETTALAPGDLVGLGISHPCTTLDKWRVIPVVSDDGRVTDTVHAFF